MALESEQMHTYCLKLRLHQIFDRRTRKTKDEIL